MPPAPSFHRKVRTRFRGSLKTVKIGYLKMKRGSDRTGKASTDSTWQGSSILVCLPDVDRNYDYGNYEDDYSYDRSDPEKCRNRCESRRRCIRATFSSPIAIRRCGVWTNIHMTGPTRIWIRPLIMFLHIMQRFFFRAAFFM